MNGAPRNKNSWRKEAGYVEQQEILYPNLSVKETLSYAAQLKLPSSIPKGEKLDRVNALISELVYLNLCFYF